MDAAYVCALNTFIYALVTVPLAAVLVSVQVDADCTKPTPLVVHAATLAPMGASVTRPFTVVVCVAPLVAEPMVIAVVEPEAPPVPMFRVLVEPEPVTPVMAFKV